MQTSKKMLAVETVPVTYSPSNLSDKNNGEYSNKGGTQEMGNTATELYMINGLLNFQGLPTHSMPSVTRN